MEREGVTMERWRERVCMFGVEIKTKKERWREWGREGEREGYSNKVGG